ncbi:hypothetical protein SORBI_3005G068101 [Sorghum bicolor]|uniref:F-box domain-containing protein n=1 Tax=Sorghum bicolor TaxID=4558 RepID=A0A1Z5RH01_SORBI|nr:hypothetical protein SORBI_3005G068101 [Sorghum bicolor]
MEEEDRLSSLPDDLLHAILRGLPLKQWLRALAASRVLDLTDRDFARDQSPARAAAMVSHRLRLHTEHGVPLDVLRQSDGSFGRDVIGWIAAAVRRGAREVEVDVLHLTAFLELELPGDLFQARNSLEWVALGGLSLRVVPLPAAGLAGLRSLSLSHADVTNEAVRAFSPAAASLAGILATDEAVFFYLCDRKNRSQDAADGGLI